MGARRWPFHCRHEGSVDRVVLHAHPLQHLGSMYCCPGRFSVAGDSDNSDDERLLDQDVVIPHRDGNGLNNANSDGVLFSLFLLRRARRVFVSVDELVAPLTGKAVANSVLSNPVLSA